MLPSAAHPLPLPLSSSPPVGFVEGLGADGPGEGGEEEEERRKKRFFNNLVFFKDVENVKPGIFIEGGHVTDGLAAAAAASSNSAPSSPAISRRVTDAPAKRQAGGSGGSRATSNQKGSLEEGDTGSGGNTTSGGLTPRADRLRKVTSGRQMDSFLKNARLTTNAASLNNSHAAVIAHSMAIKKQQHITDNQISNIIYLLY
jgi:hypothetical protein